MTGHTTPVPPARGKSDRSLAVSIRDVARAAGVSDSTVSRVINQSPSVKGSTRDGVLKAIAEIGFWPNRAARALAGGRVQSVTVLASNTSRYGHAAGLEGIEEAAREAGFAMSLRVIESGAPVAAMIPFPEDGAPTRPSVWIDEFDAEATSYLLGLGHATVHHLSIPCWAETTRRMTGWQSALEQAGAPVPALLLSGWNVEWGYQAGRQIARDPSVTAVLCGKLDIAVGAIRAMHEAGRSTPRDVSIVGVDDVPLVRF